MAEDRWYSIALPLLEDLHHREGKSFLVQFGELADTLALEPMDVYREVERLIGDGLLTGNVGKAMTGGDPRPWRLSNFSLTGKGARVIGSWPSDDPFEALLGLLDSRIAQEPDEDKRSKLKRLKDGFVALGREVGGSTIASVLVELGKAASF